MDVPHIQGRRTLSHLAAAFSRRPTRAVYLRADRGGRDRHGARTAVSFVTAVALQSASIWLHDASGERQISLLEGNAAYPKFTPDGKKLCYRIVKAVPRLTGTNRDPGEVWVADLDSGRSEPLAPGFQPLDYAISTDGKQVVMEAPDGEGKPRLWLAPFDRPSPPRQIPGVEGRSAQFGPSGEIFFRHTEGSSGFVYRVRPDGTGLRKALEQPVFFLTGCLAGRPVDRGMGSAPGHRTGSRPDVSARRRASGRHRRQHPPGLVERWRLSVDLRRSGCRWPDLYRSAAAGARYCRRYRRGDFVPSRTSPACRERARIDATGAPGPSRDVYAFERRTVQRNLYRIPIP